MGWSISSRGTRRCAKDFEYWSSREASCGKELDRRGGGWVARWMVNGLEAGHSEKQKAERAQRAARAIQFRLHHTQQAAIIRQAGQGIADGQSADLIKEPRLVQHGSK